MPLDVSDRALDAVTTLILTRLPVKDPGSPPATSVLVPTPTADSDAESDLPINLPDSRDANSVMVGVDG